METEHFIWSRDWELFSSLFQEFFLFKALNKETGDLATVKCGKRGSVGIEKEAELLRELQHENIVKMIGLEKVNSGSPVLVMEYLNGDCMNYVMSQAKHFNGLPEFEILQLLHDLVAMKEYLKEKSIVHGNMQGSSIYRFKKEDGKVSFKLVGFRDAEKAGSQGFIQGVISSFSQQASSSVLEHLFGITKGNEKIDLFHSGMVLYSAIVGEVPFRSVGYNDPTLIQEILGLKPSGAISGVFQPTGRIEYANELPDTCIINKNLCKLIEPILAGILDKDFKEVWSCEQYFERSKVVLCQKPVYIFLFNEAKNITLYMNQNHNWKEITKTVSEMTNVPLTMQLYLFKNSDSFFVVEEDSSFEDLPSSWDSSPDSPVILLDLREKMCKELVKLGYPSSYRKKFENLRLNPTSENPPDSSLVYLIGSCFTYFDISEPWDRSDFRQAKRLCSIAHSVKHNLASLSQQMMSVLYAIEYLTKYLKALPQEMKKRQTLLKKKMCVQKEQLNQCKSSFNVILNMKISMQRPGDDIVDVDDFFESSSLLDEHFSEGNTLFAGIELAFTSFDDEVDKLNNLNIDLDSIKIDWFSDASAIVKALDGFLEELKTSLEHYTERGNPTDNTTTMDFVFQRKRFNTLMKDLLDIVATAEETCSAVYRNKLDHIMSLFRAIRFYKEFEDVTMTEERTLEMYDSQIMRLGKLAYMQVKDVHQSLTQMNNSTDGSENGTLNHQRNEAATVLEKLSAIQCAYSNMKQGLDEQNDLIERVKTSQTKLGELIQRADSA